jgi:hypothetical protein
MKRFVKDLERNFQNLSKYVDLDIYKCNSLVAPQNSIFRITILIIIKKIIIKYHLFIVTISFEVFGTLEVVERVEIMVLL